MGKRLTDDEIAEALKECAGFFSVAARKLGVERNTVRYRVEKSSKLMAIMQAEKEKTLDLAEYGLRLAIARQDPWAIKFVLTCKGRERGYCQQYDLHTDITNAQPVIVDDIK